MMKAGKNITASTPSMHVFHIGLHKTGSTYLQKHVFPNLKGIQYIQWRNLEYYLRLDPGKNYLTSCEGLSGTTFAGLEERYTAIRNLSSMFPGTRVAIGFRQHGGYLASLYSQYLRYGGKGQFSDFFSTKDSQSNALLSEKEINYRGIIESVTAEFGRAPYVYLMHQIFREPAEFLQEFCQFADCEPAPASLMSPKARNKSLKHLQGEWLRKCNVFFDARFSRDGRHKPYMPLMKYRIDPPLIFRRWLSGIPSGPLVDSSLRAEIDELYQEDWRFVSDYAQQKKWL